MLGQGEVTCCREALSKCRTRNMQISKRRSRGRWHKGLQKRACPRAGQRAGQREALERAEVKKNLNKTAADNAEKLHPVKCSTLKVNVWLFALPVWLYWAEQRA